MNDYITDDLHLVPRYPGVTLLNVHGDGTTTYAYNDLGDRLQETVNGVTTTFTMDLASGLTQVLDDGTNTYLYGNGRIAQENVTPGTGTLDTEYFLGDALGSVRKLTDASGAGSRHYPVRLHR